MASTETVAADPEAFLQRYCTGCHGRDSQEGDLRIDRLPLVLDSRTPDRSRAAQLLARVVDRLEADEMPPPGHPRPTVAEVKSSLQWFKTQLASDAQSRRANGRVPVRRLNALEYEKTVQDLLGIGTPFRQLLPQDELAEGFGNSSQALSISMVHIRRYMTAADTALSAAMTASLQRENKLLPMTVRFSFCDNAEARFWGHSCNESVLGRKDDELWFYGHPNFEAPAFLVQLSETTRNEPGWYQIRISASAHDTNSISLAYSVWTAADNRRRDLVGYFDAPADRFATIEFTRWFEQGETLIVAPYRINKVRYDTKPPSRIYQACDRRPRDKSGTAQDLVGPALRVSPVEVRGPLHHPQSPSDRVSLFGDVPLVSAGKLPAEIARPRRLRSNETPEIDLTPLSTVPATDAEKLLKKFARRAFRRPVSDEEIQPFLEIAIRHFANKDCFETAMIAAYQALLCSPEFLLLMENPGELSDHALASRLSYFLWRTSPDKQLRDTAAAGRIRQPGVLRRETQRLLSSPRCDTFVNDFLDHWLNLREIDATTPDRQLFPEYYENFELETRDGLLHASLRLETQQYFSHLLRHNKGIIELVNSDFTFLNNRLAEHYELPSIEGVKLRRVTLPTDSQRGGLLTQASVLKVTANGVSTSPVLRGRWILDRILGRPSPPPPPNAGSIEPDTRGAATIREQLDKHKGQATCASCHRRIDPPGFALEAFDPTGRYRTFYRSTEFGKRVNNQTWSGSNYESARYVRGGDIECSGKMQDGSSFSTPGEFKTILAKKPDLIARCLAARLIAFGTGQITEPGDLLALDKIVSSVQKEDYGIRFLIHEIVQSDLFRMK